MIFTADNSKAVLGDQDGEVLVELVRQLLQRYPDEFLQIPFIRNALATMKIDSLNEEAMTLGAVDDPDALIGNAVSHNMRGLMGKVSLFRPSILVTPLRSISMVGERLKSCKVLSVGPRTEAEIYTLVACGFDPANIRGLDLISYSDYVDAGDMHAMPYEDDSFDVVVLGWVLAYSNDQKKAASEVLRVLKPGGIVAVGCEYTPLTREELRDQGSDVSDAPQFKSTRQIFDLFDTAVAEIYFNHEIHPARRDQPGSVMAIFRTPEADEAV